MAAQVWWLKSAAVFKCCHGTSYSDVALESISACCRIILLLNSHRCVASSNRVRFVSSS
jgi:hypothetical protein